MIRSLKTDIYGYVSKCFISFNDLSLRISFDETIPLSIGITLVICLLMNPKRDCKNLSVIHPDLVDFKPEGFVLLVGDKEGAFL